MQQTQKPLTARVRRTASGRLLSPKTPSTWTWGYTNGPGWSHAQVKRMAKKRRNVMRNRRAHRGKKA